tara:strand:+ start:1026 stop:1457 length:432 start_codon:yes stop_codon:yes gene_type:complete
MIWVDIHGQLKFKNQVAEICEEVLNDYCPQTKKHKFVDIFVYTEIDDQCAGLCSGDREGAEIEIARKSHGERYTYSEMIRNLCHELIHAKQFMKGELHGVNMNRWYRQDFTGVSYRKLPWEMEAYGSEKWLYKTFFKEELNLD